MRQAKPIHKLFQARPGQNYEKFDNKTVEFICDSDGTLLVLTGRFVVHSGSKGEWVEIHYAGRLDPFDAPCVNYVFHVSDADLRSAVPAKKAGSPASFLLERPLWSGEGMKLDDEQLPCAF